MSGSTSTPKQVDVTKFLQCSLVDPKEMASEYKFNRHGDFKKLANDALAPNASPNDLKKSKAGLLLSKNIKLKFKIQDHKHAKRYSKGFPKNTRLQVSRRHKKDPQLNDHPLGGDC
ncbi:hypothetical protein Tco_1054894 [Tanacetum coccineum]|uniref:Srp40 C-terminal domain-containing protein n=1 Tax=Tanacetum coccineum TaxID=301880 RepID=A0ABQ5GY28_9ASTR